MTANFAGNIVDKKALSSSGERPIPSSARLGGSSSCFDIGIAYATIGPLSMTTRGPDITPFVQPGARVAGRYIIERQLGSGGMGVVFAARHEELDELFAIKFLSVPADQEKEAAQRLLREARAAARLRNEHVARVIDAGRDEEGRQFLVMEYLVGADLHAVLKRHGPLPIEEAVGYILQACVGLSEAHRQGIVHRDLKPENLFLTQHADGWPLIKVLDFGISKLLPEAAAVQGDPLVTSRSVVMGSPSYMSPEQVRSSQDIDARTDVWAIGVILYQLLSGRLPFDADQAADVMVKVLSHDPPPLRDLRREVSEELAAVVARTLRKDPLMRYRDLGELARALRAWAPHWAASAPERVVNVLRKPAGETPPTAFAVYRDDPPVVRAPADARERGPRERRRSPWARREAWVMLGLAVGLLAALGWGLLHKRAAPAHSATVEEGKRREGRAAAVATRAGVPRENEESGGSARDLAPAEEPPTATTHERSSPPREKARAASPHPLDPLEGRR